MTVVLALAVLAACSSSSGKTASGSSGASGSTGSNALNGVFTVTAGKCDTATPSGSFFRMVQSGGTPAAGPFVSNSDSTCADQTVTPLSPGDDGGLRTGAFQTAVLRPQPFFGVPFEVSTNAKDPQTGATVKAPTITHNGSTLSGDLSAVSVAWNSQQFNQGAPKPGGPASDGPKGTYDETTHQYTLEWTSRIEGGPFNGFTGMWHLEGTFQPA
jgi:hypothetical protein